MNAIEKVLADIDAHAADDEARLAAWLRIPSISAQPAHAADCRAAGAFACAQLAELGFSARLAETAGHPAVIAHHPGPGADAPHLLYYGHYDVQPADPLDLWNSPPFEPVIAEGPHGRRIVARGAVDDKGQTAMWLGALRAWHRQTGSLPCRVSVLIEGEEEVGSASLAPFIAAHRDELKADIVVISDTNMWDIDTPSLTVSLRGLVGVQVDLRAASRDLHSGLFGGSALNPINALTVALGQLRDVTGRIRIPGFYDGIAEPTPEQRAQWQALGFDEARFLGGIGLSVPVGEQGRGGLERLWARPTADINGIWGGYQGAGFKTVIPAEASAKISFRLAPGQDPDRVMAGFKQFMREAVPADAKLTFTEFGRAPGIDIPLDNRFVRAAAAALADEFGRPAAMIGSGGSIPVVELFRRQLGLDSLLMGFGLDDDQVHSPNEKFELRCLHRGTRSHARLLGRLAG